MENDELEWKSPIVIQDGQHNGEIKRIVRRTDPYDYIDIWISVDDTEFEIKYGCPANLSPNTKLGKVMLALGGKFEAGVKVSPEKVLKGKKVTFMTLRKKAKDGNEYSEIIEDSIKPLYPVTKV